MGLSLRTCHANHRVLWDAGDRPDLLVCTARPVALRPRPRARNRRGWRITPLPRRPLAHGRPRRLRARAYLAGRRGHGSARQSLPASAALMSAGGAWGSFTSSTRVANHPGPRRMSFVTDLDKELAAVFSPSHTVPPFQKAF